MSILCSFCVHKVTVNGEAVNSDGGRGGNDWYLQTLSIEGILYWNGGIVF